MDMERPSQGCASILQRVRFAGSVPSSNDLHNWQWVLNLLLDRPVLGGSLFQFIAPVVFAAIRKRKLKVTVVELLIANNSWVRHLSGSFTMHFLLEFGIGKLCDLLEQVHLSDEPDTFTWHLTEHQNYSVASAYGAMFLVSSPVLSSKQLLKTAAPPRVRFFFWLCMHRKCWTAARGFQHEL